MAGYADESPCTHWIDGKSGYNWASCPFMQPGQASAMYITKYYEDVDDKTTFSDYDYVDDAARQRWGGTWRIPTDDEWAALRDTDNYSWVTVEDYLGTGMNGKLVTRLNGPFEGNSIFLPAVGYRHDDSLSGGHSYYGYYWSSTLRPGLSKIAYYMRFDYSRATQSDENRNCGLSIRPVAE
jgi:uncharacterized protein (TIGR02145 family)